MPLGADPLAPAVSLAAFRRGRHLPAFIVRKTAKSHGQGNAVEGRRNLPDGTPVVLLEDAITTNFQHWLGRHSERKRNRLGKNAYELVYETSLVNDLCTSAAPSVGALKRLTFPVRALYGEDSDVRERGEELVAELSDCTLTIHPGCTHSVLWEEPRTVRDELLAWTTRGLDARGSD